MTAPERLLTTFFKMLTQLSTAAGVIQLRGAMIPGPTAVYKHQSPVHVSDDSVLAFLGSTPVILSDLPPHVKLSERLVYRSCITLQVGKIDTLFKNLASKGSYPIEEPDFLHLQPFQLVIWSGPSTEEEIDDLQSNVFVLSAKIQESLKGRYKQLSIQRGAWAMSNLAVRLQNLEMFQESLTIARCAVDLYKTLTKTNEDVYGPCLANALRHMTASLEGTGDLVHAYKVITEAVTLVRRLVAANPTFDAEMQLAGLLSWSAFVGRLNEDPANSLRDAEEATQSYERLIGKPASMLRTEVTVMDITNGPTAMTLEGTRVFEFADALKELHYGLSSTTRKEASVNAGIEALVLYRALEQGHNGSNLSESIAALSSSLASNKFIDIISADDALSYARQTVSQYEKIFQKTGVIPTDLLPALAAEARLLSRLGQFDEAYGVCQKIQRTAQNCVENQQLRASSFCQLTQSLYFSNRHSEAALVGEKLLTTYRSSLSHVELCHTYSYTCWSFRETGNHTKSIQIAEAAVSYSRVLAFQDPEHLTCVAEHLSNLAKCLSCSKNYERAIVEGHEALKLYSNFIGKYPHLLDGYIKTIRLNMSIPHNPQTKFKSVERSKDVVQYCRALVKQFPAQQIFLLRCIRNHARLLEDLDQLADASAAIEEALDWFNDNPAQDAEEADLHTDCVLDFGRFLRVQGHPVKASSLCEEAIRIGQPFKDAHLVAHNIFMAKVHNLSALYYMGRISLAISKIEDCLNFASEHDLEDDLCYTWCLELVSCIYRCSGDVDKALPLIRRLPSSWILSDLLADTDEVVEALRAANESVQEMERWKIDHLTVNKEYYAHAQYSLALRLFANNDLSQARELLIEVRSFYQQHSQARNIWFVDLAVTLWALCLLECASNRHQEGIATRTELTDLRKRLRLILPSLADVVEVALNWEKNFIAWKNLIKRCDLSCGHQVEKYPFEASVDLHCA